MNSLRAEALPAKCKWRSSFVSLVVFLASLPLFASPPKVVPSRKGTAVQSDAVSLDLHPAAADLQLSPELQHKGDAMAMFVTALIDEDNAETDKAFGEYRKTLDLDPGYTALAVKVAAELARRGDAAGGINVLKDAIKASPKEPAPYLCLSQFYAKYLNKPELAVKYASQALELNPRELPPYLALYELYTAGNRETNAKQILDRAMKQENSSAYYWFQLGEFLAGHLMKETGASLSDDLKKLNTIFAKSLSYADDDAGLITRIADYYLLVKQPKDAIPLYLKVIDLKKKSGESATVVVRDNLARSLLANGQSDDAVAVLKQLISENPLRYESYGLLGEIHEQKGDFQNALDNYLQALLLDSSQPSNHMRVADMYLKTRQFNKAVDLLAAARAQFSDLPQITYSLAVAQSQAARYQEAIATFEEALHEAETSQPEMLNGAFYFAYGSTAEQGGMTDRAAELLRKSIEIDPANSAQACNYLGYMWVDRGEHLDEAAGLIKRALEMEPENPAFLDSLGWYFFKTASYEKALAELQKAAAGIKPEDAVVYEHLGDTYSKLGNAAQALVFWQKAARLASGNKGVQLKIEESKQKVSANPAPTAR
jgi:tetratricopeptide (TPR) repeat protein